MNETLIAREQPAEETGAASGVREKLDIPRCQYGVPCSYAYQDGYIANCDEPAIAKWTWESDSMFVCEEHDLIVEEAEEAPPVPEAQKSPTLVREKKD